MPVGLTWQPILVENFVVIAPESCNEGEVAAILTQNPYISFKRSKWAGERISKKLKDLGIKVESIIETDSVYSIWEMVACGIGVSVVPYHNVIHYNTRIESNKIKVIPLSETPFELITGLVTRSNDPKSSLISVLYGALFKLAEEK